jgi:hypothetical protein
MAVVMITGGRDYANERRVYQILDAAIPRLGMSELILGDCPTGLDAIGLRWATERVFPHRVFRADWNDLSHANARIRTRRDGSRYDANAGPRRNRAMVQQGRPNHGIAFRGGEGTRDAIRHLQSAGIDPILIDWEG